MALTLNTSIDGEKFYSCDFPDLSISTTYGLANVTIVVNGSTVLSTRYYAVSGRVTVRNLVSLIELSMEQQYKSFCSVGVTVSAANETVSASCQVLLCKVKCMTVDVDTFLANSFLTTNNHRLTTLYNDEVVPFYIAGSGNYSIGTFFFTLNVLKADGTYDTYETFSGRRFSYGVSTATISAKSLQDACEAHFGISCRLLSHSNSARGSCTTTLCHALLLRSSASRTFSDVQKQWAFRTPPFPSWNLTSPKRWWTAVCSTTMLSTRVHTRCRLPNCSPAT